MNNSEYPNIPQAAIDAAYRLMDRVKESRRQQTIREAAFAQVKPFFDDLNEIAARVEKEIAEIHRQEALDKKSAN